MTTSHRGHMHSGGDHDHDTNGRLSHGGWHYDVQVFLFDRFSLGGKVGYLRHRLLDTAQVSAGQHVLDVGCGTGTLALLAARRTGRQGRVVGVDPAPRQIEWANTKARFRHRKAEFRSGVIEDLPFSAATFDTVTSTLMIHHLPRDLKEQGLREIFRVLKPKGRLAIADFNGSGDEQIDLSELVRTVGFVEIEIEQVPFPREHRGWSSATILCAVKT